MIGTKIKVTTPEGVTVAVTTARSVVEYERRYNTSVIGLFTGTGTMEGLFFLAWQSLVTSGEPVTDFETWLSALVDLEVIDGSPPLPPPGV